MDALLSELADLKQRAVRLAQDATEYRNLAMRLEGMSASKEAPLQERYDLGAGFTVSATIADVSRVRVRLLDEEKEDFVDMPRQEAIAYAKKAADTLNERAATARKEVEKQARSLQQGRQLAEGLQRSLDAIVGPQGAEAVQ